MRLEDTIDGMVSSDYVDRFVAEVQQLKIRIDNLETILERESQGRLGFKLNCPVELLLEQLEAMEHLLKIYNKRAEIEGITIF